MNKDRYKEMMKHITPEMKRDADRVITIGLIALALSVFTAIVVAYGFYMIIRDFT